jgi:hypothetical protein
VPLSFLLARRESQFPISENMKMPADAGAIYGWSFQASVRQNATILGSVLSPRGREYNVSTELASRIAQGSGGNHEEINAAYDMLLCGDLFSAIATRLRQPIPRP